MKDFKNLFYGLATAVLACSIYACSGPAAPPERKKMPAIMDDGFAGDIPLHAFAEENSQTGLPFATGNVDLFTGGKAVSYYSVSLPDIGLDSMALSLVNNYQPLLIPMLANVPSGKGLILDLRSNTRGSERADYKVSIAGRQFPLTILWNQSSAYRVGSFIAAVKGLNQLEGFQSETNLANF